MGELTVTLTEEERAALDRAADYFLLHCPPSTGADRFRFVLDAQAKLRAAQPAEPGPVERLCARLNEVLAEAGALERLHTFLADDGRFLVAELTGNNDNEAEQFAFCNIRDDVDDVYIAFGHADSFPAAIDAALKKAQEAQL